MGLLRLCHPPDLLRNDLLPGRFLKMRARGWQASVKLRQQMALTFAHHLVQPQRAAWEARMLRCCGMPQDPLRQPAWAQTMFKLMAADGMAAAAQALWPGAKAAAWPAG